MWETYLSTAKHCSQIEMGSDIEELVCGSSKTRGPLIKIRILRMESIISFEIVDAV